MGDLIDAFRVDAAAAQDTFQKRAYVGETIGPTERHDEYGIEQGNGQFRGPFLPVRRRPFKRTLRREAPGLCEREPISDHGRGYDRSEHADLAGGHFELRRHDHLLRGIDAWRAAAHQLRGAEGREHDELECIHVHGPLNHDVPLELPKVTSIPRG